MPPAPLSLQEIPSIARWKGQGLILLLLLLGVGCKPSESSRSTQGSAVSVGQAREWRVTALKQGAESPQSQNDGAESNKNLNQKAMKTFGENNAY